MVGVPASSEGARARLPGRNPPPCGSCKGVFRLCPPAPLLVAGGTLTFLNSIPALLSVFDFRTGPAIPGGGGERLRQKSRKTIAFLVLRLNAPLRWSSMPGTPSFRSKLVTFALELDLGSFRFCPFCPLVQNKKAGLPPFEGKSDLLTQTNVHFRDTYLKPVYRCILS